MVGISALAGALTALGMPRGPITPFQVVAGMVTAFLVGGLAGYIMRSRWAILLAPAVFFVACEAGRIAVTGPTVDRPDLSTTFGVVTVACAGHETTGAPPPDIVTDTAGWLRRRRRPMRVVSARTTDGRGRPAGSPMSIRQRRRGGSGWDFRL